MALNPIIKFTTLFGLLAVEMGVANQAIARPFGVVLFLVALFFVYRSFYGMRISSMAASDASPAGNPKAAAAVAAGRAAATH